MKKVAVIGSGEFQLPLIMAAKNQGVETHVFSWGGNESVADFFYKISIVEKEQILDKCKQLEIDGICSIGSDLANITVNYVALAMGLVTNSEACTIFTTNKFLMRKVLKKEGIPIPEFTYLSKAVDFKPTSFPIIVKPIDRSGSRGISLVEKYDDIERAIESAYIESFTKEILIEQYISGREFSVESISYNGEHEVLQITEKFTTEAPDFIETGHTCPARITAFEKKLITDVIYKLLDAVCMINGASHSELKIDENGDVYIIEIGSRMGGDYIGSDLVKDSTGFDFVTAVLDISLGKPYQRDNYISDLIEPRASIVKFLFNRTDLVIADSIKEIKNLSVLHSVFNESAMLEGKKIKSSADRYGHILVSVCKEKQSDTLSILGF
ncbi:ATP-grasp domain-containing protein [Shewanella litoralis]|uniref:ATP-grasp domain-containing protein n=1 Tax=Shewanella litoralis TaxID=2282700 RepID=A0ABQ2RJ49_9GAMM|nr:ATP-grasp domain-containing protein [Shewanella litoralis]GGQ33895.1 hypothetical protein GCM10009411_36590 [Shewanella litoralis]